MDNVLTCCVITGRACRELILRNLKIVCTILIILCLALFIAIVVKTSEKTKYASLYNVANVKLQHERQRICSTPQCIKKAHSILQNMNASVDPCEDFHKFACTNMVDTINIPADQPTITVATTVKQLVYKQIRSILEEPSNVDEVKPLNLAKKYYKSCMDIDKINNGSLETFKRIVHSIGGWPLLEGLEWDDGKFDWKQTMYALRKIGYNANYFFSVDIVDDLINDSGKIITIGEGDFKLFSDMLRVASDIDFRETYLRFMVDVAALFGANKTLAVVEMHSTIIFEAKLYTILPIYEYLVKERFIYNPMTVAELVNDYTITNWREYLVRILNIPNFQLRNNETVNVRFPDYLHELENLLHVTPNRITANYIMWKVVLTSIPYLSTQLRHLQTNFMNRVTDNKVFLPDWKRCTAETLSKFEEPLKSIYGRKHFHNKSKEAALEMLLRIKNEFIEVLKNTEWMDTDTKRHAVEKASSYNFYSSSFEFKTDEQLNQYYFKLNFRTSSYLRSMLEISLFTLNNEYKSLQRAVADKLTHVDITKETNLFTDVIGGMFHESVFHTDLPYYINYGSIGYWMGHVISHSFYEIGMFIDKDGIINHWWTDRAVLNFKDKKKCLTDKFSNYTVRETGHPLNGKRTFSENLADSAGIKTAYLAYNRWIKENGVEQQLPGLNYTAKQMFWISLANLYCSKYRLYMLTAVNIFNSYVLCKYRIIGSFSDSQYFANDFNCSLGSPMNPKVKCNVW